MRRSNVPTSDNKYVQYRLMSDTFNTTEANWQGVDIKPIRGSKNLIESNGTLEYVATDIKALKVTGQAGNYTPSTLSIDKTTTLWKANYGRFYCKKGTKINIKANPSYGIQGFIVYAYEGSNQQYTEYGAFNNLAEVVVGFDSYIIIVVRLSDQTIDATSIVSAIAENVLVYEPTINENAMRYNYVIDDWVVGGLGNADGAEAVNAKACRSGFLWVGKGTEIINTNLNYRTRVHFYNKYKQQTSNSGVKAASYVCKVQEDCYIRIMMSNILNEDVVIDDNFDVKILVNYKEPTTVSNVIDYSNPSFLPVTEKGVVFKTLYDMKLGGAIGSLFTNMITIDKNSQKNVVNFNLLKVTPGAKIIQVANPVGVNITWARANRFDINGTYIDYQDYSALTITTDSYIVFRIATDATDATDYIEMLSKCFAFYIPQSKDDKKIEKIPYNIEIGTIASATGKNQDSPNYWRTDYMLCGKGTRIYIPDFHRPMVYYYGFDHRYIKSVTPTLKAFIPIEEECLIRVVVQSIYPPVPSAELNITWEPVYPQEATLNAYFAAKGLDVAKAIQSNRQYVNAYNPVDSKIVNLLWFTDAHEDYANIAEIKQYFERNSDYLDDAIHTGDIAGSHEGDAGNVWADAGIQSFLNVIGNHDVYIQNENYPNDILTALQTYDEYFKDYISQWSVQQPTDAATVGKCYYYKDYKSVLRLIVLDQYHIDSAQSTWLENVLSDAKTNSLSVVIALHAFPEFGERVACNFSSLDYTTEQFQDLSAWTAIVDAFITAGGKFVCWFAGHYHHDQVAFAANTTNQQLMLCVECTYCNGGWDDANRVRTTITENSFNIISFEPSRGILKLARFGNPYDHYLRRKDAFCYDYINKQIIKN